MSAKLIREELDQAALVAFLTNQHGGLARDMTRRAIRVQTAAKRLCPANHGRLRGSITVTMVRSIKMGHQVVSAEIGTNVRYAMMVHNGTGIYGPTGQVIRPTNARVLVWTTKPGPRRDARGRYIAGTSRGRTKMAARYVRGQKGKPFLKDALIAGVM